METFEKTAHYFVDRLFITMAFKVAIGAFMTTIDKSIGSKSLNLRKKAGVEFNDLFL